MAREKRNRLYPKAVLQVLGEQNLTSAALRSFNLAEFMDDDRNWNEEGFKTKIEKGTKPWAGIPENCVQMLRGGRE